MAKREAARDSGAWVEGVVADVRATIARKAAEARPPTAATEDEQAEAFGRIRAAWESARGALAEPLGPAAVWTATPDAVAIACPAWPGRPFVRVRSDGGIVMEDGHGRGSTASFAIVRAGDQVETRWYGEALEADVLVRKVLEPWLRTLIAAQR